MINDQLIRDALHQKTLSKAHQCPDTLVLDELGLKHARARIDIATINGIIHGYEIKSEVDTLSRLSQQLETYTTTLQKLTIVSAQKHLEHVQEITPKWVGIIEVSRGKRGAINFKTVRRSILNPTISAFALSHLLWRAEAMSLVEPLLDINKLRYKSRIQLYEEISNHLSVSEIVNGIKQAMKHRSSWRDHQLHA